MINDLVSVLCVAVTIAALVGGSLSCMSQVQNTHKPSPICLRFNVLIHLWWVAYETLHWHEGGDKWVTLVNVNLFSNCYVSSCYSRSANIYVFDVLYICPTDVVWGFRNCINNCICFVLTVDFLNRCSCQANIPWGNYFCNGNYFVLGFRNIF